MSLVNNSANNFKDFLDAIKPYLNYQLYDLSGQGVEAMNFSTNEKVIGTWIDGKPLYQKTVDCGALPNATEKTINHNISNIDKIVSCSGIAMHPTGIFMSLPLVYDDNDRASNTLIQATKTNIRLVVKNDRSAYTSSYVTLRYTKTTDSAVASGEKIVGQWTDGKPIYEKTWDMGRNIAIEGGSSWNVVFNIDSSNIDKIISSTSMNADGTLYNCEYDPTRSNHTLVGTRMPTGGGVRYVTLRYTKTTD